MQNRFSLAAATVAASALLAACNSEPQTIQINKYDAQADELKNAAPVAPPPMAVASRIYRCSDNSVFYVSFFNDNTATIRTTQDGIPTQLTAANGQPPFTAEGYSVSANATDVRITAPGKNNIACHE